MLNIPSPGTPAAANDEEEGLVSLPPDCSSAAREKEHHTTVKCLTSFSSVPDVQSIIMVTNLRI